MLSPPKVQTGAAAVLPFVPIVASCRVQWPTAGILSKRRAGGVGLALAQPGGASRRNPVPRSRRGAGRCARRGDRAGIRTGGGGRGGTDRTGRTGRRGRR